MSDDVWSAEDEERLRELRRRKKAVMISKKGRLRRFGAKKYKDEKDAPNRRKEWLEDFKNGALGNQD